LAARSDTTRRLNSGIVFPRVSCLRLSIVAKWRYVCRPIPRLPAVTRDLSLVVTDETTAGRVAGVLEKAGGELCESIEVVAEFRGGSVPTGRRSLTFRVVYRDPKARGDAAEARTLTDPEVDAVEARMLEAARGELDATLRT